MRGLVALVGALAAMSAAGFDLQGHRGARGLAPENTLPAFAAALSLGVSTLELDVGVSADGVVVIAHDRRLNPDITPGHHARRRRQLAGPSGAHHPLAQLRAVAGL